MEHRRIFSLKKSILLYATNFENGNPKEIPLRLGLKYGKICNTRPRNVGRSVARIR